MATKTTRAGPTVLVTSAAKRRIGEDIELARAGDFDAYQRLNGFLPSSTVDNPQRIRRDAVHDRLVKAHLADLLCVSCGRWHGGLAYGIEEVNGEARVKRVKCRWCGCEDAAGPLWHVNISGKSWGKTVYVFSLFVPFRLGLLGRAGIQATALVIGANEDESVERLSRVEAALRRPMHEMVFGSRAVPMLRSPKKTLRGRGSAKWEMTRAYGILGVPNGRYPDVCAVDDAVTLNSSMIRPAEGVKILEKLKHTVLQGKSPWMSLDYLGNAGVVGDANHWTAQQARAEPKSWTFLEVKATRNAEDKVVSYWPEGLPASIIEAALLRDERAARRDYFCEPISEKEIAFRDVKFFLSNRARGFSDQMAVYIHKNQVPMLTKTPYALPEDTWKKLIAVDLAYTGADAKDKKNRSKTGIVVGALNLAEGRVYVFRSSEEEIPAGGHIWRIRALAEQFGTTEVALESLAAQKETVQAFRDAGFIVHEYNPTALGSKTMRKLPVAEAVNGGRVLLWGNLVEADGQAALIPADAVMGLYEHMKLFPARSYDDVDALEILCRKLWELWGTTARPVAARDAAAIEAERWTPWWDKEPTEVVADVLDIEPMVAAMGLLN